MLLPSRSISNKKIQFILLFGLFLLLFMVLLHFLVLFIALTVLFQLIFIFIYNTLKKNFNFNYNKISKFQINSIIQHFSNLWLCGPTKVINTIRCNEKREKCASRSRRSMWSLFNSSYIGLAQTIEKKYRTVVRKKPQMLDVKSEKWKHHAPLDLWFVNDVTWSFTRIGGWFQFRGENIKDNNKK